MHLYLRMTGHSIILLAIVTLLSCAKKPVEFKDKIDDCFKERVLDNSIKVTSLNAACLIGTRLPVINGKLITGDSIGSEYFKRPTVINLWFETCAPCIAEIPGLNKLKNDYPSVNFLSITTDQKKYLDEFLIENKFDLDHLLDGESIIAEYLAQTGYPTTYILNNKRIILDIIVGGRTDSLAPKLIYEKVSKWLN